MYATAKRLPFNPLLQLSPEEIFSVELTHDHPAIEGLIQICGHNLRGFPYVIRDAFLELQAIQGIDLKPHEHKVREFLGMVLYASGFTNKLWDIGKQSQGVIEVSRGQVKISSRKSIANRNSVLDLAKVDGITSISHRCNLCRTIDGKPLTRKALDYIAKNTQLSITYALSAYHFQDEEMLDVMRKLPHYKPLFKTNALEDHYLRWCKKKGIETPLTKEVSDYEYLDMLCSLKTNLLEELSKQPLRDGLLLNNNNEVLATLISRPFPHTGISSEAEGFISKVATWLVDQGADWYLAFCAGTKGMHTVNFVKNRQINPIAEAREVFQA